MDDLINIQLSRGLINNILVFLDRAEVKGLQEVSALCEIVSTLNSSLSKQDDKEV